MNRIMNLISKANLSDSETDCKLEDDIVEINTEVPSETSSESD